VISPHLPALQVVLPLIAAPLCVVIRHARATWLLTLVVSWLAFAISVDMLVEVLRAGPITYELGNWPAPWGIVYRIDALNGFILVIVAAIGAVVATYAPRSVAAEIEHDRIYLFYSMYLLALTGLLGIVITGDAFNLFVFLEISSLSSYVLVSLGSDRRAITAAYRYLIMGTIGATFILIGIGLLYMATGTLNMADLATRIAPNETSRTVLAAFGFITVGTSLKLALFPLHQWLPNAYAYAPSTVSTFLAGTATKASIYILLRFIFTIFGAHFVFTTMPLGIMIVVLAVLAMFVASTVAIFQEDVKRMLAYSSIAQIGYIMLGVGFATTAGLTAGILHIFNHALMKGALFLALGCVFLRLRSVDLDRLHGIGRAMPFTMAAFVVGGLSLIGIPLTAGFVSKWYLVLAALEKGWWPVAALIVLSSLLAVVYVWRVIEVAYFHPAPKDADGAALTEAPLSMLLPLWLLAGANIYFGIETSASVGIAHKAAAFLLGAGS
jgi:multicomponent Na+:H+ antiporter subunit D